MSDEVRSVYIVDEDFGNITEEYLDSFRLLWWHNAVFTDLKKAEEYSDVIVNKLHGEVELNFIKNNEKYTINLRNNANGCGISLINQTTGHCSCKTVSAEELYNMLTTIDKTFIEE